MDTNEFKSLLDEDSSDRANRILNFPEYVEVFSEDPKRRSRNSVQYIRDALDHFGREEVEVYNQETSRLTAFDSQLDRESPLIGLEQTQQDFYSTIDSLAGRDRPDKFILLHGPNGSGKTTFIESLIGALEAYSQEPEGHLYRFNWVFPTDDVKSGNTSLGFVGEQEDTGEGYAHLDSEKIQSKIPGQLSDHPLLVLPEDIRAKFLESAFDSPEDIPKHLKKGGLNPANKEIFQSLLLSYDGELEEVLKHVQIERWTISQRYRRGAAIIEPQLHVDANVQQVTLDENYKALPSDLQHLDLSRVRGDLAEGNRGVVAFEDFKKRQQGMNHYLMGTIEDGQVRVENQTLQLDCLFIATANETNLRKWRRKSPNFYSMRGRMELIGMPYLVDYRREQEVYDQVLEETNFDKHIAPYTTRLAALWAVTTRLEAPDSACQEMDNISEGAAEAIVRLDGAEKADLYAEGTTPSGVAPEVRKEIKSRLPELVRKTRQTADEGMFHGASPREMKTLLQHVLRTMDGSCFTPLRLLEAIEDAIDDPDRQPNLDETPHYGSGAKLVAKSKQRYLEWLETDLMSALDYVEQHRFDDLFEEYIEHVQHFVEDEKVYDRITDSYKDPDENLMQEIEEIINPTTDTTRFRDGVMNQLAAYKLEHENVDEIDYRKVFPEYFRMFRQSILKKKRESIYQSYKNTLEYISDGNNSLTPSEVSEAKETLENLKEEHGFCDRCLRESVGLLVEKWEVELDE